jgi:hemoglobin/transferrin/lactoferrin receptor protein
VYVLSLNLKAKLRKDRTIKSHLNYIPGKKTEKLTLGHIPPLDGQTDLILHSAPLTLVFYVKYQAEKPYSEYSQSVEDNEDRAPIDQSGNLYGIPSWWTFNSRAEMKLGNSFSIQVALENMLDVQSHPFASVVIKTVINFIFTLIISILVVKKQN